jgi:hypothetical protein
LLLFVEILHQTINQANGRWTAGKLQRRKSRLVI